MDWPLSLYRALLLCYPAEFRYEYGAEMAQAFRDRWREEPGLTLWLNLFADTIISASKEHSHMLLNDLIFAIRTLRKAPVFTAAAVLTLALGVGANSAIFTVVNAELLRPLPFADPDRLVRIYEKNDRLNLPQFAASVLNYLSWKEQTQTLAQVGAIGFASFNLTERGDPEQFNGATISPSMFPLLGLQPVRGRAFRDGEDRPGGAPVVMIGEGLWKRRKPHRQNREPQRNRLYSCGDRATRAIYAYRRRDLDSDADRPAAGTAPQSRDRCGSAPPTRCHTAAGPGGDGHDCASPGPAVRGDEGLGHHAYDLLPLVHSRSAPYRSSGAAGRGGAGADDRVRERGESAAVAGRSQTDGDRGPHRDWRQPGQASAPTTHREFAAVDTGWRGGADAGGLGRAHDEHQPAGESLAGGSTRGRFDGVAVHPGNHTRHRAAVRNGAGLADAEDRPDHRPETGRAVQRRLATPPVAQWARGRRTGDGGHAAGGGRSVDPESAAPATGASRLPSGSSADVPAFAAIREIPLHTTRVGVLPGTAGESEDPAGSARGGALERHSLGCGELQYDSRNTSRQLAAACGHGDSHRLARCESGILPHDGDSAAARPRLHWR